MSVLASIFPMIINTYAAVDSVSPELEETARSFTAGSGGRSPGPS